MAVQAVTEPTGKKIGTTTVGSTSGGVAFGAITIVLVWILSEVGVSIPDHVAQAITIILSAVGALIGGKLTPSNQHTEVAVPVDLSATSQVTPEPGVVIPDGTGVHRADVEYEETVVDADGYLVVDDGPAPTGSTSV